MSEAILLPPILLAAGSSGSTALTSFVIYLAAVFALAWLSSRQSETGGFISEYFLGSRNLGVWAFALTFAATSASGGSFVGFPALIYTYGWVLALWIAGYMVVPIVAMGLLGKRLNRLSRIVDAVTIPDVLERRFSSPATGILATILIVLFMFYFLLAQFKAGSEILVILLRGVPAFEDAVVSVGRFTRNVPLLRATDPDYLLCLAVFSAAVIVYVVYGGFRAVVWTDVMQGIIMFLGVLFLLALGLHYTGGLETATQELARRRPPRPAEAKISLLSTEDAPSQLPKGTWLEGAQGEIYRTAERAVRLPDDTAFKDVPIIELISSGDIESVAPELIDRRFSTEVTSRQAYAFGDQLQQTYIYPPGHHRVEVEGFLPLSMAFSFFVFWPFGAAGQPSNMVRLMAFRNTQTLKLSIVTVAIYFSFIYFSLVVIFCCARVLMPGMEVEADRVMPEMAMQTTQRAGLTWLAGFLLAAPFAAVMSSVDSFLLLVSSSLVRDIYQRHVHPQANEKWLKRVTYLGTLVIGLAATFGALRPPTYLQAIIVDASGFLAGSFLVPVALSLFWRGMTGAGAIAGMLAGCFVHSMFSFQWTRALVDRMPNAVTVGINEVFELMDALSLGKLIWALIASLMATWLVSKTTRATASAQVDQFFEPPAPRDG